ncbi:MAG: DedA family protein [Thermoprotei archaeon]|nr:MAG: DedA family protein [Thermoprotei archaeon]
MKNLAQHRSGGLYRHRIVVRKRIYLLMSIVLISTITALLLLLEESHSSGLMLWLIDLVVESIAFGGYLAITLLMILDGACIPIPSEIILAFSGFLIWSGRLDVWTTVLSGSLGSLLGSLIAYVIGLKFGREFIERYGCYLMLSRKTLDTIENWFKRYGKVIILVSRFIPGLRTAVSIPAGIGRMPIYSFVIFTVLGSTLWNCLLIYLGVKLRENWIVIGALIGKLEIPIVLTLLLALGYVLLFHKES